MNTGSVAVFLAWLAMVVVNVHQLHMSALQDVMKMFLIGLDTFSDTVGVLDVHNT
jgi:hypothetical protein